MVVLQAPTLISEMIIDPYSIYLIYQVLPTLFIKITITHGFMGRGRDACLTTMQMWQWTLFIDSNIYILFYVLVQGSLE